MKQITIKQRLQALQTMLDCIVDAECLEPEDLILLDNVEYLLNNYKEKKDEIL